MKKDEHPCRVAGYRGSHQRLAHNIGQMDYGEVAVFIGALADDIKRQAEDDLSLRGRRKLASRLSAAAAKLSAAQEEIAAAAKISAPYMK